MARKVSNDVTAGKLLRRGTDGVTTAQLKDLLDNEDKVQKILDDINARRAVFIESEGKALAAVAKLEKAELDLAAREDKLSAGHASLVTATAEAEFKHKGDMDVLTRRNREVTGKETAAEARAGGLDAREKDIEAHGRTRETELAARQETVEAQEERAEQADAVLAQRRAVLDKREKRLDTASKMVKQAVATLG